MGNFDRLRNLTPNVDRFPASYIPIIRDGLSHETRGPGMMTGERETVMLPNAGSIGDAFMVKVEEDGTGDDGDKTTNCTFVYTVKTLADETLEESVSPEQARFPLTTYLAAGVGGRSPYGLAAYDEDETLRLMWLPGERPDASTC